MVERFVEGKSPHCTRSSFGGFTYTVVLPGVILVRSDVKLIRRGNEMFSTDVVRGGDAIVADGYGLLFWYIFGLVAIKNNVVIPYCMTTWH